MKRKINNRLVGTAALAIIATLLLSAAVCYNIFRNQIIEDLRGYASIVEYFMEDHGLEISDSQKQELQKDRVRITLIAPGGEVLYDTAADPEKMENHGDRTEVLEAKMEGEGWAVRSSQTLQENTYYYALRLEDGNVLRISRDADSLYAVMESAAPWLLAFAALLFAVCCVSSYFLADGLMRPIRLIAQDVDNIEKTEVYEELKPYIEAIQNQHEDVVQNALMRQEFTANVSHELKTPLTAISGYSELIENKMVSSEEEIQRFAKEIHGNAGRLLTLINDVIRLSELDAENTEEAREPVNLTEVASTCVDMLRINAGKHHVTIDFEGENAVIMSTRQMTEEILYNLCDNAIRYNKEGGSVHVQVKDRLDTAVLTVKDTGIGIPREHQERIFERFYRVDKSRSKSTGGTGLGLAIVKHILLRLNASIDLESEVGKGTEITITFPAVRGGQFK